MGLEWLKDTIYLETMEETYLLHMVVVLDPCMLTWVTYPQVIALFTLDSHNTSYFYKREDGTYYWHHCRKDKDDIYRDADIIQLDLLGDPILSKDFIMKEILSV